MMERPPAQGFTSVRRSHQCRPLVHPSTSTTGGGHVFEHRGIPRPSRRRWLKSVQRTTAAAQRPVTTPPWPDHSTRLKAGPEAGAGATAVLAAVDQASAAVDELDCLMRRPVAFTWNGSVRRS
jgi:hypothetical protein